MKYIGQIIWISDYDRSNSVILVIPNIRLTVFRPQEVMGDVG